MKEEETKAALVQQQQIEEKKQEEEVKGIEEEKKEGVENGKVKPKKGRKKAKELVKLEKEEDLDTKGYFTRPVLVSTLWDELDPAKQKRIVNVWAKGDYCYALELTHPLQKAN